MQIDLESKTIYRVVMKTAIPMVIAQIVNLLYNVVDRIFVGRIPNVGVIALGGVGVYNSINIIIMAFALLVGAGGAPKAAICLGKKDQVGAERLLGCCVLPLIVLSAFIIAGVHLCGKSILLFFGATEMNLPYAWEYTKLISIGIGFHMLTMGLNTFINTQGKTLLGMVSTSIGAAVNIALDAVFIIGLDMGVAGAAIATVIGQFVSCMWVLGFLASKNSAIRIKLQNLIPKAKMLYGVLALGLSSFIATAIESFVTILLNYVLKKYGAAAFAGYYIDGSTIAISISTIITMASSFILMPINGFVSGIQPIISYNFGAGNTNVIKKTVRFSCIICIAYAGIFCLVLLVVPQFFSSLFTTNLDIIMLSKPLLRLYVSAMTVLGIQSVIRQFFSATGMAKISIWLSMARKVLYIPLIVFLPMITPTAYSVMAIYFAEPVSDVIATGITCLCYRSKRNIILHTNLRSIGGKKDA